MQQGASVQTTTLANYNPKNPYKEDRGKSVRCYEWDPQHNGGFAADFVDMRGYYNKHPKNKIIIPKSGEPFTSGEQIAELRRLGCPLPAPVCDSAKADYTPQYCQDSGNLASGETSGGLVDGTSSSSSSSSGEPDWVAGGDTSGDTDWDNDSMASNLRNDIFGDTTTDYDGGNESSSSASTSQGGTTNNNVTPKNNASTNNNTQGKS